MVMQRIRIAVLIGLGAVFSTGCERPAAKPPKPAKIAVTTMVTETTSFQESVDLLGRVVPSMRVEIRPPESGRIRYGRAFQQGLTTGARVREGDFLFQIESPDLELRLKEAELTARAAETELERARKGVEAGILPTAELEVRQIDAGLAAKRLEKAEWEHKRLAVKAPMDGVLKVERRQAPGTDVSPNVLLAELAGDGALKVEAWVPAVDLERLRSGLAVECHLPRRDAVVGLGTVVEVAQEIEAGGVARAVIEVHEDQGMPRVGEGIELVVRLPIRTEALVIPQRAVVVSGQVRSVYVLEKVGKGLKAAARLVQIGGRDGDRVEILDGLKAGERIAVEGAEYLADGLLVEDVEAKKKKGRS